MRERDVEEEQFRGQRQTSITPSTCHTRCASRSSPERCFSFHGSLVTIQGVNVRHEPEDRATLTRAKRRNAPTFKRADLSLT